MQLRWYAVYVKSRSEKKVAEIFASKGLSVYCPTITVTRQWSDRKKKVKEPLFKSYVFVRCNADLKLTVLQTYGVVGFVNWLGKPAMIRDAEIDAVKVFLDEYENVELITHASYKPGQDVEVKFGPMSGNFGQVIRQNKHKVILRIEVMNIDLVAEVPKSHLEPV